MSSMAQQVGDLVARAVKRLDLCSNDPICAEHGEGSEHYTLQGRHFTHARIVNPILETACELFGDRSGSPARAASARGGRHCNTAQIFAGGGDVFARATVSLKSSQAATVTQVRSSRTSASG